MLSQPSLSKPSKLLIHRGYSGPATGSRAGGWTAPGRRTTSGSIISPHDLYGLFSKVRSGEMGLNPGIFEV